MTVGSSNNRSQRSPPRLQCLLPGSELHTSEVCPCKQFLHAVKIGKGAAIRERAQERARHITTMELHRRNVQWKIHRVGKLGIVICACDAKIVAASLSVTCLVRVLCMPDAWARDDHGCDAGFDSLIAEHLERQHYHHGSFLHQVKLYVSYAVSVVTNSKAYRGVIASPRVRTRCCYSPAEHLGPCT